MALSGALIALIIARQWFRKQQTCGSRGTRFAILGKTVHTSKAKVPYRKNPDKINLLVDIQAKLQAGKGPGYERWAKVFNLKQMAQTINFLTENNITDYEALVEKTNAATDRYHELSQQIKEIEKRMAEITELKKHIINYSKTKGTYIAYRESGFSQEFYGIHIREILNYNAAKNAFNKLIDLQIPSITKLNEELVKYRQRKRELSMSYRQTKTQFRESSVALSNVSRIFLNDKFDNNLLFPER